MNRSAKNKSNCARVDALITPGEFLGAALEVPGDKSISHRVAIFSALAHGTSTVVGFLQSDDCIDTMRALEAMGAESFLNDDGDLQISGTGGRFLAPRGELDFGNSGTGLRLMAGLLAGQPFNSVLAGDESLCKRPMDRIRVPLEMMGAGFEFREKEDHAPFEITGGGLSGIEYDLPVASAQVKSSILLAALFSDGVTVIRENRRTRDHTERLMRVLDVPIRVDGLTVSLEGPGIEGPEVEATEWYVPGDFSSAAYWVLSAAARPGSRISIQNVGLNPRRTAFLDVIRRMGADVKVEVISESDVVEPYGDIKVQGTELTGTTVEGDEIPNLIDELPLVAVAGALASGETVIKNAGELRMKESDRIKAMVTNLAAAGAEVEETEDGLRVRGPVRLKKNVKFDSFKDHRVAMAMAILSIYGDSPMTIKDVASTETSYPGFWGDLRHRGAAVAF